MLTLTGQLRVLEIVNQTSPELAEQYATHSDLAFARGTEITRAQDLAEDLTVSPRGVATIRRVGVESGPRIVYVVTVPAREEDALIPGEEAVLVALVRGRWSALLGSRVTPGVGRSRGIL